MEIDIDDLEEMELRDIANLIENAGDSIADDENLSSEIRSLGMVCAEIGYKIKSIDGGRINF